MKIQSISSKKIIVDLSNVLFLINKNRNDKLKIKILEIIDNSLKSENYYPYYIADASLRHKVDDKMYYENLVNEGTIIQAPAGRAADIFILKCAKKLDCYFLSNDLFRDYVADFGDKWISKRRITFMYVDGRFIFA
ncbi:MAG: NYN domain-containing protein [Candidatus Helarchaeota archaeon]